MMWRAAMFEEENALPGAEVHLTIDNRDGFASAREHHANVRGACRRRLRRCGQNNWCLRARGVRKISPSLLPAVAIGVFHNNKTATGVLNKNGDGSVLDCRTCRFSSARHR